MPELWMCRRGCPRLCLDDQSSFAIDGVRGGNTRFPHLVERRRKHGNRPITNVGREASGRGVEPSALQPSARKDRIDGGEERQAGRFTQTRRHAAGSQLAQETISGQEPTKNKSSRSPKIWAWLAGNAASTPAQTCTKQPG